MGKQYNEPEQIHERAIATNIIETNMTATPFCDWLKDEFELGHGHAMAIWNLFLQKGWIKTKHSKIKKD